MIAVPTVALSLLLAPTVPFPPSPRSATPLDVDRPIERRVEPVVRSPTTSTDREARDHYSFEAEADSVVEIVAEQQRLDVWLTLIAPDGAALLTIDSPTGDTGVETLFTVAAVRGRYRIVVAFDGDGGGYTLRRRPPRKAQVADRHRATAVRATATADALHLALPRQNGPPVAVARVDAAWERAIEAWHVVGDPSSEAAAWVQRGILGYDHSDSGAGEAFEAALALKPRDPSITRAVAEGYLGSLAFRDGRFTDALAHFDRELSQRKALDHPYRTAVCLNNRARAKTVLGDFEGALLDYDRSLTTTTLTATWINRGRLLLALDRFDDAMHDLDRALHQTRATDDVLRAAALAGLGQIALRRGDLDLAERHFTEAWKNETDPIGRAQRALDLATVDARRGRIAEAHHRLIEAIDVFRQQNRPYEWAAAGYRLGMLAIEQAETTDGEDWLRRVALVLDDAPHGGLQPRLRLHWMLARLARQRDQLRTAERHLGQAAEIFETFRARRNDPARRFEITRDVASLYEERVEVLLALHRRHGGTEFLRRALAESERARSRDLLDRLVDRVEPRGRTARELADAVRRTTDTLLDRHVERAHLVRFPEAGDPRAVARLDAEIARLNDELDALNPRLAEASAGYAELIRTTPLDVDALQALIDVDTTLLVFGSFGERAIRWTVRHDTVTVADLGSSRGVDDQVADVYDLLAEPPSRRTRWARTQALQTLADTILPAPDGLGHGTERLAIVADGALAASPFSALPWRDDEPLLASFELVHLPSASALGWLRRRAVQEQSEGLVAVIADPPYDLDPRCRNAARTGSGLARLPASATEAEAILDRLPTEASLRLAGFDADREQVLAALPKARVAHFAVHAAADTGPNRLPGLFLAERDHQCRPIDGLLDAEAIYNLDLRARLVVLSGCETALGETVDGEGRTGLIRSFLHAGAERVIASRWKVDDAATARLMTAFYNALLVEGRAPAAALRTAQLALRDQPGFSEPFYWAAFDAFGDWRPTADY